MCELTIPIQATSIHGAEVSIIFHAAVVGRWF